MREAGTGARGWISSGRLAVAIRAPARPRRRGGRATAPRALCLALVAAGALAPRTAHAQLDAFRRWFGLDHAAEAFSGDLDGMVERRRIRMLVVPSRTFYFVDQGTQRGLSYDLGQAFEKELLQVLHRLSADRGRPGRARARQAGLAGGVNEAKVRRGSPPARARGAQRSARPRPPRRSPLRPADRPGARPRAPLRRS